MMTTQKLISLGAFFILATGMAALLRLDIIDPFHAHENGFIAAMLNNIIFIGWTPAIAAFAMWRLFGDAERRSSWTGRSAQGSLLIALVPAFVLGIYGVPNDMDISPRIFGALLGLLIFAYAVGEEIGLRGSMHAA